MPPSTPPAKPQIAGSAATKPAVRMEKPRSLTRKTGNHVRKKYVSVMMQYTGWVVFEDVTAEDWYIGGSTVASFKKAGKL